MEFKEFKNKYIKETPKKDSIKEKILGWQSETPAMLEALKKCNPSSVVEVGSWLGKSVIFIAENCNAEIIAVDTYLGSNEVLWRDENVQDLTNNFSKIYDQFCANITFKNLNHRISPLPMTSSSAAELFLKEKVKIDMVYLDAGHREREVFADLEDWWPLTNKLLIGDDYSPYWLGVQNAVNCFVQKNNLKLEINGEKFLIWREDNLTP